MSENKSKKETEFKAPYWLPLDVAATIYPASRNRTWSNTYRFAIILKEDVDPDILKRAVEDLKDRLPTYFVCLQRGLFWYYLKNVDNADVVVPESEYPCRQLDIFNPDKPCFRVLYYKNRIALEVFHGITDGNTSSKFMNTIVARYLELKGVKFEFNNALINYYEPPTNEELEDCYKKAYRKKKYPKVKDSQSYQVNLKRIPNYFKVTHGIIPVEDLKKIASERGLTITDHLLAVYLYSFYKSSEKPINKPIKISVPVGLRDMYGYTTFRNFSLFSNLGFNPNGRTDMTFGDIADSIKGHLREAVAKDEMHRVLCENVKLIKNPVLRLLPNAFKRRLIKVIFKYSGQKKFVSCMTNIGIVNLPQPLKDCVERHEVMLGGTPYKQVSCAIISDGIDMNITITGDTENVDVPRWFFRTLADQGARIRVECNVNSK